MSTERVSSENWSNGFSQAGAGRESAVRAAEEASFSLLYDEALAVSGDDGLSRESGSDDSSHDLLAGWESLLTQPGIEAATQTSATGNKPCLPGFAGRESGDVISAPGRPAAPANAIASGSAAEFTGEANRAGEVSSASAPLPRAASPKDPGRFSKNRLIEWMDKHAHMRSLHLCAMFFRRGMEAAGASTADRPTSGEAADYGPYLVSHGAQEVPLDSYQPQAGDTAVFGRSELHPAGHIEIFDGERWVSDFVQHAFSPYQDAGETPPFKIYRLS